MPGNASFVDCILGNAYYSFGDDSKAFEYRGQHVAIAKEAGYRAGEGTMRFIIMRRPSSTTGSNCSNKHTHLAMAKEVGDRAGEGAARGNLGNAYDSQGHYSTAIEYHAEDLAMAQELGDPAREGRAYGDLGTCHMHLNVKAVAYHKAQHA